MPRKKVKEDNNLQAKYGYEKINGVEVPCEYEQKIISLIESMRLKGMSAAKIAGELDNMELRPRSANKWCISTIEKLIKRFGFEVDKDLIPKPMEGRRFGRLVVSHRDTDKSRGKRKWICVCDCGNIKSIYGYQLLSGRTKSCGCLSVEMTKKRVTKHSHSSGGKTSGTYNSWAGIIQRCSNEKCNSYYLYGARGITFDKKWRSFNGFYEDMGDRPEGYSIERIDVNGNYCKENCKWIPINKQALNRRTTVLLKYKGETVHSKDIAEDIGVTRSLVEYYNKKYGSIDLLIQRHGV